MNAVIPMAKDSECECHLCTSACENSPGWFSPAELPKAAKLMRMEIDEFFKTSLGVDWWVADEHFPETFVVAPAIVGMTTGHEYPGNPNGVCVFFESQTRRCTIHEAKPLECKKYRHELSQDMTTLTRHHIVKKWQPKQTLITRLLKRTPEATSYSEDEESFHILGSLF